MVNLIEFPIFDGVSGDLWQWILWLEDFFVRERFTADEKMNLAQSLLEGKAYAWFSRNQKILIFQSWEELRDTLWLMFGDFADLDRILKQRAAAKLRRMSRPAIAPHESISSPATLYEPVPVAKFPNQQIDEISGEKKDESHEATIVKVVDSLEDESITQTQVPVSKLEHSLQIPKVSPNVCENSQAVVGCEHQRSIQKNIRMDVVNGDVERIQPVMSITKIVSAHQVFDKTSPHKDRLKPKTKRKLSLSLKTWMFKFKSTSKRRKSLDVKSFSVEEIAWLMRDSKEIYRSCVDKEFKAVVAGCGKLFDRFQTSPSYALDVVNKTSKPWETHTPFTSTHVASVNSLSFAVGTADKFELCVGHETGIMRLKLLLHSGFAGDWLTELDFHISEIDGLLVFPWNLMLLEFFLFLHLEDKVCLSGASNSWCGWFVFDRGKYNIISGDVITLERDGQTVLLVKAKDAHVDSLIVRIKEVWIANMVEINTGIFWAELKWIIWSVSSNIVEVYTKIIDKLQIKLKQGMDLHGASWHCSSDEMNQFHSPIGLVDALYSGLGENVHVLLAAEVHESGQQQSSYIWHRWRRKDCTRSSSCVLPLQFSFFKLEDKLVLRGESIDTIHQSYHGKKKQVPAQQGLIEEAGDVAEASAQGEDSGCERSFAVESREFI